MVIHENPILLVWPILVIGDHAVIGRPPEKFLELVELSLFLLFYIHLYECLF
ncbi:MAG: hypothetical protein HRT90_01910 [Candidatus Margulisbacteria bacterium]|nr:hypothetical protein [Candidatus Margulisiibacteriota bacterium]